MEKFGYVIFTYLMTLWTLCVVAITDLEDSGELKTGLEIPREVAPRVTKRLNKCPIYPRPVDCEEVLKNGNTASGIYTIWPRSRVTKCETLKVYCDMKTDGGGWTVIQRRCDCNNPEDYFRKNWMAYKTGFGKLGTEFWIGNDNIFAMTNQGSYAIRFDMRLKSGTTGFAQYESFWIEDEERNYRLHLKGFSGGNAGDSMSTHNLREFYTEDKPNKPGDSSRDPRRHKGGWWFNTFPSSNLNGLNYKGNSQSGDGIVWWDFGGWHNSMEFTEIKVRPINI